VRAIGTAMGLTAIIWTAGPNGQDYDTNDWHIPAGYPTNQVLDNFANILASAPALNTGFIILEHDLYQQTVDLAIGYILPNALSQPQFTLKSIISCLNKPLSDAYIETNNNSTNPPGKGYTTLSPSGGTPTGTGSHSGSSTAKGTQSSTTNKPSSAAVATRLAFNASIIYAMVGALVAGSFGAIFMV